MVVTKKRFLFQKIGAIYLRIDQRLRIPCNKISLSYHYRNSIRINSIQLFNRVRFHIHQKCPRTAAWIEKVLAGFQMNTGKHAAYNTEIRIILPAHIPFALRQQRLIYESYPIRPIILQNIRRDRNIQVLQSTILPFEPTDIARIRTD